VHTLLKIQGRGGEIIFLTTFPVFLFLKKKMARSTLFYVALHFIKTFFENTYRGSYVIPQYPPMCIYE
jgi:hypothetical protein